MVLFVASNFVYLFVIQKTDWNYRKRIEALTLNSPKNDVLVIGNSLAMDGIDTEFLSLNGYPSYNLSMGGATLKSNILQLEEYLSMYAYKPKYVVLGLGSYFNYFTKEEINPIVEFTHKESKRNLKDIPMVKFRWLFKKSLNMLVSKTHRDASLHYGQLRFKKQVYDKTKYDETKYDETKYDGTKLVSAESFPIDAYKSAPLIQEIIDLCSSKGITLIMVEMPGFKQTRHKKSFDYLVLDEANNNGILLDYNNFKDCEMIDDQKDWVGNSHLNMYGAKKVTKRLLADLNKIKAQNNPFP